MFLEAMASLSLLCVSEHNGDNECFIVETFYCVVKFIQCLLWLTLFTVIRLLLFLVFPSFT